MAAGKTLDLALLALLTQDTGAVMLEATWDCCPSLLRGSEQPLPLPKVWAGLLEWWSLDYVSRPSFDRLGKQESDIFGTMPWQVRGSPNTESRFRC